MNKIKVVAFMGKSGSGKDTIVNAVHKAFPGLHKKVSTTTRPPRENEVEGVDYYFVDAEQFAQKVIDLEMIEASDFRDWFYGTEMKALKEDKINIGVFNPNGVRALKEDSRIELLVFYVVASDQLRLIRALSRESNPDIEEIFRRYHTDKEDFSDIDFGFVPLVNNGKETIEDIVQIVKENIIKYLGKSN